MEGRVLGYEANPPRGCLVIETGIRLAFETRGNAGRIGVGARVVFKVAELDGERVAVNVRTREAGSPIPTQTGDMPPFTLAAPGRTQPGSLRFRQPLRIV